MDIFVATGNAHKLQEIDTMMRESQLGVNVYGASALGGMPDVEETGSTFAANAELKARALVTLLQPGQWALADDSGIEVDALGGEPGIYSARYAGAHGNDEANNDKLLAELADTPMEKRTGRFVCALALVSAEGECQTFLGKVEGHILFERHGDNGFGYDPLFRPSGYDQSFGVLPETVKNDISHRSQALRKLRQWLTNRL
ncbi:MAG: dITP/XTP pyrophosphatase [Puniceicoccaceae bacterium 5H]|nr:MAG: dITP/XTP pyrophosphatase [Puniceicoccaceae bacterium 5H]